MNHPIRPAAAAGTATRDRRSWIAASLRGALLAAAAGAAVLAGCGGGGNVAGVDSGGTGSFAVGPISGFSSVIVNRIRYDDTGAAVYDGDGAARSRADLRLGMVVEIEGSALAPAPAGAAFARQGTAGVIRYGAGIVGPLQAVSAGTSEIVVLGQAVDLTPTTAFGDGLAGGAAALAALPSGTLLEVHGYPHPTANAAGRYTATRIDRAQAGGPFRLHGTVRDHDGSARRFRIGAALIDYAALGADAARDAGIADGATIRVRLGTTPDRDGAWSMQRAGGPARSLADRDDVDVEGLVTAFTDPTRFSVDGIPVDATRAEFDDGARGRIALGARVEVEGRLRGGVLVATEVELRDDGTPGSSGAPASAPRRIELEGTVESIDPATQTFRLRGVVVSYAGAVFDDGDVRNLRVGVRVEVEGWLSADGTTLDAREIEFDD
ncbi:MAG: DUF5666 domain-containing protein [Lautropia sp.]